jgi:hypothetical protein
MKGKSNYTVCLNGEYINLHVFQQFTIWEIYHNYNDGKEFFLE